MVFLVFVSVFTYPSFTGGGTGKLASVGGFYAFVLGQTFPNRGERPRELLVSYGGVVVFMSDNFVRNIGAR
jgi:hypothetical protein